MNASYLLLTVLLVGAIGVALVALNKHNAKKEFKKYRNYNIMTGVLSAVVFVTLVFFINVDIKDKRAHFKEGGFLRCIGKLDDYLISNKEYILLDDYFIKDKRVLSIDNCSRIE